MDIYKVTGNVTVTEVTWTVKYNIIIKFLVVDKGSLHNYVTPKMTVLDPPTHPVTLRNVSLDPPTHPSVTYLLLGLSKDLAYD